MFLVVFVFAFFVVIMILTANALFWKNSAIFNVNTYVGVFLIIVGAVGVSRASAAYRAGATIPFRGVWFETSLDPLQALAAYGLCVVIGAAFLSNAITKGRR